MVKSMVLGGIWGAICISLLPFYLIILLRTAEAERTFTFLHAKCAFAQPRTVSATIGFDCVSSKLLNPQIKCFRRALVGLGRYANRVSSRSASVDEEKAIKGIFPPSAPAVRSVIVTSIFWLFVWLYIWPLLWHVCPSILLSHYLGPCDGRLEKYVCTQRVVVPIHYLGPCTT